MQAHIEDSFISGTIQTAEDVAAILAELDALEDAEATPEDIAELNALDEDEDILDEWNAYYMSTRL
jgi:YbbR domain-containing protein